MSSSFQNPRLKVAGGAIFPSLQTSVSTPVAQKTGPILETNVSSERIRPQTRDFPDPHVTGSWSRRTLGQERGMLSTPAVPGVGSSVNSQMIEDKITQASWDGKYAALQLFGIDKCAGFFQNVVGLDDPAGISGLRALDKEWSTSTMDAAAYAKWNKKRQKAIKSLKGKDLGWLGKYVEVPGIHALGETSPYSGSPTGSGYLSKQDLLNELQQFEGVEHRTPGIDELIKKSPYKYYTSTKFE